MKRFYKKLGMVALVGSFVTFFFTSIAHASTGVISNVYNLLSNPQTSVLTLISYVINVFLNLFVSLGGWLITLGLNLNNAVFNSPTVLTGFSVALSIANLGFVLGIIVIAIATILRSESYGIKQMLWKLVVMAILVNFGLVITGPIVGLADNFAGYFLNATGGASNFALSITTAFSTSAFQQQPTLTPQSATTNTSDPCAVNQSDPELYAQCQSVNNNIKNSDTSGANGFLINLSSSLFSAVFIGITAFTLILIGLLLVVRYVYLSILLILLPLAWLTWIFPGFNYFSKWWGLFIKWTMFPAIVLFFLYLAIQSVTLLNGRVIVPQAQIPASANSLNSPSTAIMAQTGQPSFPQVALDEIVAVALCLGGLFAANSLSLTGSETIVHGAKWAGGQVTGFVGKQSKRAARYTYQRAGGDKLNTSLQRSRIPLVSRLGRVAGDITKKGGADLVKEDSTKLKLSGRGDDELVNQLHGTGAILGAHTQLAYLQELQKRGKLDKVDGVGGKDLTTWLAENKRLFDDYGQGKLRTDIDKALFSSGDMRRIAQTRSASMSSSTMMDKNGIIAPVGTKVTAADLAGGAEVVAKNAEEAIQLTGPSTKIDHQGQIVRADDLLRHAQGAMKEANDVGNNTNVEDKEGLLGAAGTMSKAGELMQAASEKFVSGLDKGDAAKSHPEYLFAGKEKIGLDIHSIKALGKAVAHGLAIKGPQFTPTIINKIDKEDELRKFIMEYKKSIKDGIAAGKIDATLDLENNLKKILGRRYIMAGGAPSGGAPAAPTAPAGGGGSGGGGGGH